MSSTHWMWRVWRSLAVVLLLGLLAGFTYEQIGRWQDSQHPFRIGRAVDVDGRSLNINCAGSGSPAVILESGGGGYGGYGWRNVQAEVAKFTTVCWYDRAGEGWSDPAPTARSSATIVHDLQELLQRAPVAGPYVLVGHSIGGEYVRIFTSKFPSEVAGVVLVDSSHPDQREPPMMLSPITRMHKHVRQLACLVLPIVTRLGVIRLVMHNTPVYVPPEFSSQQSATERAMRNQRVKAVEAEAAQGCAATKNGAIRPDKGSGDPETDEAARSAGTLGDRPLIVLTAGQYWTPDDPVAAKEIAEFHDVWVNQLQPELARLSTNGRQIVVENSDHGIPEQAPASIVGAVHEIVTDVRNRQGH
ncbi:MAG: alpha/beta hydrolase [Terriglobales bacterium]